MGVGQPSWAVVLWELFLEEGANGLPWEGRKPEEVPLRPTWHEKDTLSLSLPFLPDLKSGDKTPLPKGPSRNGE